jgi:hypothetical protein
VVVTEVNDDLLRITWDAVTEAESYRVYRATGTDGPWGNIASEISSTAYDDDLNGGACQITGMTLTAASTYQMILNWDEGLTQAGTTVYYRVSAVNGNESPMSAIGTGDRYVTPVISSYTVYRDGAYLTKISSSELSFVNSGLLANTSYSYCVSAYSSDGIEGSSSTVVTKYTLAQVALAPTLSDSTTYSINVTIGNDGNPAGTQYGVWVSSDNWVTTKYVQGDKSISGSIIWQSSSSWTEIVGNRSNTRYRLKVQSRNGDQVVSSTGPESALYTQACVPVSGGFTNATSSTIRANWSGNGNGAGTEYLSENLTNSTSSWWTTNIYWQNNNLMPDKVIIIR